MQEQTAEQTKTSPDPTVSSEEEEQTQCSDEISENWSNCRASKETVIRSVSSAGTGSPQKSLDYRQQINDLSESTEDRGNYCFFFFIANTWFMFCFLSLLVSIQADFPVYVA